VHPLLHQDSQFSVSSIVQFRDSTSRNRAFSRTDVCAIPSKSLNPIPLFHIDIGIPPADPSRALCAGASMSMNARPILRWAVRETPGFRT